MGKLKLQTLDLAMHNEQKLISLIKEANLFPNCVTETADPTTGKIKSAIDFDLLRQELSNEIVEGPQERYRLDWPGKREALALANSPIRKTLRPCKDESVDFDTTQNLYIEGDNLDALKLLQESYLGKVKMIYIDPPYNTGNDFIYDDNFSISGEEHDLLSGSRDAEGNAMFQEEKWKQNSSASGRFHSEWLSMMYPRLKLARNLLREDGVIFISIDDNELVNLLKCCSEIFGADNHIGTIAVVSNLKGRSDDKHYATAHNYLVAYQRNQFQSFGLPMPVEYLEDYPEKDSSGRRYRLQGLRKRGDSARREDRPLMYYPFYVNPENLQISLDTKDGFTEKVLPFLSDGKPGRWRWGKDTSKERLNELVCKTVGGEKRLDIFQIDYAENENGVRRVKPKSLWTGPKFSNEAGSLELKKLFEVKTFDTPKPTGLLIECLEHATSDDSIILDFFSGSAATAHAVMQFNAQDGGKRRHIMIQLPEPCDEKSEAFKADYKTIAEIGKERIRRAGQKILAEWQAKQASTAQDLPLETQAPSATPPDIGFRVLKIDSSNMADVYYQPDELTQEGLMLQVDNLKPGRLPEDLLFQVLLDWGVDLALPITEETILKRRVFFVADNALAACFDTGLDEAFVKELAKRQPLRAVFRDSGYASDTVKINFEQIFKALSPHSEIKTL